MRRWYIRTQPERKRVRRLRPGRLQHAGSRHKLHRLQHGRLQHAHHGHKRLRSLPGGLVQSRACGVHIRSVHRLRRQHV